MPPEEAESAEDARADAIEARAARFRELWTALRAEIGRFIVGQEAVVDHILTAIVTGRHALLEGVPGTGKTLLIRTVARVLGVEFRRIQFTPDLMPADIIGTDVIVEGQGGGKRFEFRKGPIFGNVVLADEINRATPKTQSALLEAMEERHVTVSGTRYDLAPPFFVLATQNPIEMEGTYPLPEAQVDRFLLKIDMPRPKTDELLEVLRRTTGPERAGPEVVAGSEDLLSMGAFCREVPCAAGILEKVVQLVEASHPDGRNAPEIVRRYVRYGASPRGGQALVLAAKVRAVARGDLSVGLEDVTAVAGPALRHRIILGFEGEAEGISLEAIVSALLEAVMPR